MQQPSTFTNCQQKHVLLYQRMFLICFYWREQISGQILGRIRIRIRADPDPPHYQYETNSGKYNVVST